MTDALKRAAGALSLVQAGWVLYLAYLAPSPVFHCPANGCPAPAVASVFVWASVALAALLLLDGLLGLWGAWFAYPFGAALSAILAAVNAYAYFAYQGFPLLTNLASWAWATAVIAVVGLAVNLLASRRGSELSEQSNPMNLPVFG